MKARLVAMEGKMTDKRVVAKPDCAKVKTTALRPLHGSLLLQKLGVRLALDFFSAILDYAHMLLLLES